MRKAVLALLVVAMSAVVIGCAITDYNPGMGHKTAAKAKLWGKEVAFSGFGPAYDGTYSYTVEYNNLSGTGLPGPPPDDVTITSFRNPVFAAFNRDQFIDRDGDDLQSRPGNLGPAFPATPAGAWMPAYIANDQAAPCGFFANVTTGNPIIALCIMGNLEEIDNVDVNLQASPTDLDDLVDQIFTHTLADDFMLTINGVRLDGVLHPVVPFEIDLTHNGVRPGRVAITNGPGVDSLVQTILDNTMDETPVAVGLTFDGGLAINGPSKVVVAFDHEGLMDLMGAAPTHDTLE